MSGTEKYDPLKDEIFLPVPLKISRIDKLSKRAMLVYGYLLKFFKMNGFVRLKAETIGNDLKIPVKKVSTYTKELENKKLIKSKRTGKANEYEFLPIPDSPHAVESDSPHAGESLYNREAFREAFRESEATPDFLKKLELWRSIPLEHRKDLNKKQVVKCSIEKIEYAIERMNVAINKGGNPVRAFQNALKGDHAKFTRKMEEKAVAEQEEHDKDIIKLAEAANKKETEKEPDKATRAILIKQFRDAMEGALDGKSDRAIACLPHYISFEQNELRR